MNEDEKCLWNGLKFVRKQEFKLGTTWDSCKVISCSDDTPVVP